MEIPFTKEKKKVEKMLNKFGDVIKCEKTYKGGERCPVFSPLFAVGEFRANFDYKILCTVHSTDVHEKNKPKYHEFKTIKLTEDVLNGIIPDGVVKDYSEYSTQTPERKLVFSNSKANTSEGRRESK